MIFTEAFWPLPFRSFWYALNFAAGTLITAFAEIPFNAEEPTVFKHFGTDCDGSQHFAAIKCLFSDSGHF